MRRLRHLVRAAAIGLALRLWVVPQAGYADSERLQPELRHIHFDAQRAFATSASGVDVPLTLSADLTHTAERLLTRAQPMLGGAVLADAKTGKVLAWAEYGKKPGVALLDTLAPAASVFKLVTTAALLERAHVSPKLNVCYAGGLRGIERHHLSAPKSGAAYCHPFFEALGHSRNAVYAQLVTRFLMRSDLEAMADALGFNKPLGVAPGLKLGTLTLPYNDLEFARASAGFSGSRLSVLGGAELALTIANSGQPKPLWIAGKAPSQARPPAISPATARTLTRMMEVTVHSGTSLEAFTSPEGRSFLGSVRVAGKTGTLQPRKNAPTSTWFIGFAPSRHPEVVVSVLIQNGPVWRRKANEVARDLLRAYFARRHYSGVSHPFDN